jgi:hypothetical protein
VNAPEVRPWFRSVEVVHRGTDIVDVHVGTTPDFKPSVATRCGTLYGPGAWQITAVGTTVDHYVKLVDLAGEVSRAAGPVRPLPPMTVL